ncbi:MAG: diaminopimelate epimerase [Promethearchaeota archaeon]|nr:MAG: diaminopimelate epimerase [Candidatus Lokiarchaeota archaeon]
MLLKNLTFEKYHGLGNDYIIIDDLIWQIPEEKKAQLAQKLCQFHFSIGADGLIYVCQSEKAQIRMRIFNDDGTEAEMCGNGIRCFSKHVYENDIVKKDKINIETLKGIMVAELKVVNNQVESVTINMGPPILECDKVPVISEKTNKTCVNEPIKAFDKDFLFTGVSMGNPHAVIFVEKQLSTEEINKYGALIERHEKFPNKINVEFVKILSDTEAQLRVFERGVGMTNSCGTGTCAAVVAGTIQNKFKKDTPITVHNDGGDLIITYTGETVFMEGPVERVFKGVIEEIEI